MYGAINGAITGAITGAIKERLKVLQVMPSKQFSYSGF
jgi:hypothetical protein